MDKKNWKYFLLGVCVWLVQIAPYLFALIANLGHDFSFFVYRGEVGFSQDVNSYGAIINHVKDSPSLFSTAPLIKEVNSLVFNSGTWVNLYSAGLLYILGNLDLVLLFSGLIPITLSVFLIKLIINEINSLFKNVISDSVFVLIVVLVLLTGFDDPLGLRKLTECYYHDFQFLTGTNKLICGYMQRFQHGQVSFFCFLLWIYCFLRTYIHEKRIDYTLLSVSVVILQYTYFYYWTFACAFCFMMFVPKTREKYVSISLATLVYVVGTLPFWFVSYSFTSNELGAELSTVVQSMSEYSLVPIHGLMLLLVAITASQNKISKRNLMRFIFPVVISLSLEVVTYCFMPNHWFYILAQILIPLVAVFVVDAFIEKKSIVIRILLVNYVIIVFFLNFNFFIGFNIESYHWVYVCFYPVFILFGISLLAVLLNKYLKQRMVILFSGLIVLIALCNGAVFAKSSYLFWRLSTNEQQVFSFFENKPKQVIGGNNHPVLYSCAVSCNQYLLPAVLNLSLVSKDESYSRFITNFVQLGYSKELIIEEYKKYKLHKLYKKKFLSRNDSLGGVWPDNTTIATQLIHGCWRNPSKYLDELEDELDSYDPADFQFQLDYLIIYKPTFLGDFSLIKGLVVLENDEFVIFQKR